MRRSVFAVALLAFVATASASELFPYLGRCEREHSRSGWSVGTPLSTPGGQICWTIKYTPGQCTNADKSCCTKSFNKLYFDIKPSCDTPDVEATKFEAVASLNGQPLTKPTQEPQIRRINGKTVISVNDLGLEASAASNNKVLCIRIINAPPACRTWQGLSAIAPCWQVSQLAPEEPNCPCCPVTKWCPVPPSSPPPPPPPPKQPDWPPCDCNNKHRGTPFRVNPRIIVQSTDAKTSWTGYCVAVSTVTPVAGKCADQVNLKKVEMWLDYTKRAAIERIYIDYQGIDADNVRIEQSWDAKGPGKSDDALRISMPDGGWSVAEVNAAKPYICFGIKKSSGFALKDLAGSTDGTVWTAMFNDDEKCCPIYWSF